MWEVEVLTSHLPRSWFAVNMGTGIVSILLHNLPYNAFWLQYISYVFFALNLLLFTVFTAVSFLRYTLYPEIWTVMVRHPTQSLFLGCFPMALATLINMLTFSCASWDAWPIYLAFGLWCLDATISVLCCVLILFPMMHHHKIQTHHVTGAMLLPFVPCVVASASGGIVASALIADTIARPDLALVALLASYVLWGIGLSFSSIILALYFQRLCMHALPPREAIVSVFLPIGPRGQGGFGIQQLGRVALQVFPAMGLFDAVQLDAALAGQVFYALGIFLALLLWGAGLAWLLFAAVTMGTTVRRVPFNMGWWGFTFPLGFKVLTTVFSLAVLALWGLVAARTARRALGGGIFHAPCLENLPVKQPEDSGGEGKAV
jgi:tellurite resistance protein TehA-like permease